MNLKKLKGKIVEYGFTYETISKQIGKSKTSFSNRMNCKKSLFTQSEISKLKKLLNLTNDEVVEIFLD